MATVTVHLYLVHSRLNCVREEKRDASRPSTTETSTRRRDVYQRLGLHANKRRPKLFAATTILCPGRELFNAEWNNTLSKERSVFAVCTIERLSCVLLIESDDDLKRWKR